VCAMMPPPRFLPPEIPFFFSLARLPVGGLRSNSLLRVFFDGGQDAIPFCFYFHHIQMGALPGSLVRRWTKAPIPDHASGTSFFSDSMF